jgi:GAF domain-containing protein
MSVAVHKVSGGLGWRLMDEPQVLPSFRRWMGAVSEIARAVNAAQPLGALLTGVAEQACTLIGFDYCAVMLTDDARERVTVAGSCGLTPDYIALVSDEDSLLIHPSGSELDTPAARAFREGRTIAVPEVRAARSYGRLQLLAPTQGYRSLVASPLRAADEVTGLLVGYRESPHEFDGVEIELVELLAEQTAIAVQAARLRAEQQAVIGELQRGREQLDWAEQQHHRLMQLVLDDIGLGGLVEALASILGCSVTVEDGLGGLLARASVAAYEAPPVDARWRRRHQVAADRYEVVRLPGRAETWVAPVALGGELVGRLWITGLAAAPNPGQRRMVERFALVVGVEVLKRRHRVEVEERLSGDLIADLLRPDGLAQPQAVLDRAAALGHDLADPHWLGLLVVSGGEPAIAGVAGAAEPATVLVGRYEHAVVVLLPVRFDPVSVLRRIHEHVSSRAVGPTTLVIGSAVTAPDDYAQAYRLASGAARLRQHSTRGGVLDLRDLGVAALLLHGGAPPRELRRFAESLIMPLHAHDGRRHTELVATLRAWLEAGCSTAATAEALVVHVNTVGYRLARIDELIGRELRRPDTRLELQLALIIWDVMQLGSAS